MLAKPLSPQSEIRDIRRFFLINWAYPYPLFVLFDHSKWTVNENYDYSELIVVVNSMILLL